ncbi:hypothetical protein GCM10027440_08410 [Nocardiopsis coralliicola]
MGRRRDDGAGKVEYGAIVFLVAAVIGAVMMVGLPTDVQDLYRTGLCRITGTIEECGESDPGESDDGGSSTGPSGPEASGDEGADSEEGADSDGAEADPDTVVYDPAAASALFDAHSELDEARSALAEAKEKYAALDEELMTLLLDLMGVEDARKCLTEGDIVACLSTVVGLTPWGKGLKALKTAPKIAKLFGRWRKLKKAVDAADARVGKAKTGTRDAVSGCGGSQPRRSAFGGVPDAEPVLLSDGSAMTLVFAPAGAPRPSDGDQKRPSLDDLLAEVDKPSEPTPSLEELLRSTDGTACANPDPRAGPTSKPGELKQLHTEDAMKDSTLDALRDRSTDDIVASLKPGAAEPLRVKPDGTIMDGNHRIKILQERGIDVDDLPREIHRSDLPDDGFWE